MRLSTQLAPAALFVLVVTGACAPPSASDGDRTANVEGDPSTPASGTRVAGLRPLGSYVWNRSLEGGAKSSGTTPVLREVILRADGSYSAWVSIATDGNNGFTVKPLHGTYAFARMPKTDDDVTRYPVDPGYLDTIDGKPDDALAYVVDLACVETGATERYAYYLETDGTWHLRHVASDVWIGLNPPTDAAGAPATYCDGNGDCTAGACTPTSTPLEPKPGVCG